MKRRKLAMLLAAAMMAATLAGCGGGSSESTTAAPTEAQTEAAGEAEADETAEGADRYLVWRMYVEPKQWDPTNNSESMSDAIVKQLFEGLTVSTSDGYKPGMAETWDVSEDGKTYTFHL